MTGAWKILGCVSLAAAVLMAAGPVDEQSVSEWVSRLNAPTRIEREEAERVLLDLGPEVLDELPESSSDPAIDAALARIRERLSQRRATDQAAKATRVSLVGNGPLGEVTADWRDGEGAPRIALSAEQARRPVKLDARDVAYWDAMDRIGAEAGLWPDRWNQQGALTFRERTETDEQIRLAYPGAFRVAGGPLTTKDLPGDSGNTLYRLPVEIRAEPGVRPLFIMHAAESGALIRGNGTRIEAFTPGAAYELPIGQAGGAAQLGLDFVGPPVEGTLTFQGQFVATVASRAVPFSFDLARDAFQPAEKSQGGVTVRLRNVEWDADGNAEIAVAVVYADGASAFESYRTWVYHNDAELIVAREDGEALTIKHEPAFETVAQSPGALLLRYTFKSVPEDETIRFEYRAPTEVIEVPLSVELEGLAVE